MTEPARHLNPAFGMPRQPELVRTPQVSTAVDAPATAQPRPVAKASAADSARRGRWKIWAWTFGVALPLLAVNVIGAPYYLEPMAARVRHPWHALLRPSGTVGLTAGILAVAIFIFLWLYPLRKKYKRLAFLGSLGKWMDVHVATALAMPLLLAIHATWRADGVIGLGLLSMMVVIASGVIGRYLYVRIPRARNGVELTREEVAGRRRELIGELAETTGLGVDVVERTLDVGAPAATEQGLGKIIMQLLADDLTRWRRKAELQRRWAGVAPAGRPLSKAALGEAVRLASQEMSLQQQSRMLDATHRVFRFWHVAHRPFAVTALVAVIIHIVVVLAVGVVRY
jgi:hypothetical protein